MQLLLIYYRVEYSHGHKAKEAQLGQPKLKSIKSGATNIIANKLLVIESSKAGGS